MFTLFNMELIKFQISRIVVVEKYYVFVMLLCVRMSMVIIINVLILIIICGHGHYSRDNRIGWCPFFLLMDNSSELLTSWLLLSTT